MSNVIDFESKRKEKQKAEVSYTIRFDDSGDYIPISFTPEELGFDFFSPNLANVMTQLEKDMNNSAYMEHIANLLEVVGYNVDWTTSPEWHRDMYLRAQQFYDDYYESRKNDETFNL